MNWIALERTFSFFNAYTIHVQKGVPARAVDGHSRPGQHWDGVSAAFYLYRHLRTFRDSAELTHRVAYRGIPAIARIERQPPRRSGLLAGASKVLTLDTLTMSETTTAKIWWVESMDRVVLRRKQGDYEFTTEGDEDGRTL